MKIGVVGFCTAPGIAFAIKQIISHADVRGFEAVVVRREKRDNEVESYLRSCDLVLSHNIPSDYGILSTSAMSAIVTGKLSILPNIVFAGFHPDLIYIRGIDGSDIKTSLGPYNSQILAASFALGIPGGKAVTLFRPDVFQALGFFEEYAKAKSYFLRSYRIDGNSMSELFARWERRGVFMHSPNHPKSYVVFDIAAEFLKCANIIDNSPKSEAVIVDHLSHKPSWPVYPPIAQFLNLSGGSYLFRSYGMTHGGTGDVPLMNLVEFIENSYSVYTNTSSFPTNSPLLEKAKSVIKAFV